MNTKLNWVANEQIQTLADGTNVEQVVHFASINEITESALKAAVIDSIDKAVGLLNENIEDDSRYLLFEWDVTNSTLVIVVTDDSKESDSRQLVKCKLLALDQQMTELANASENERESKAEEYSELVQGWIHNYLTTCSAFMRYSLIAVFHNESRQKTKLL
ncbi:MAG: hypothetical protein KUG78_07825 [Kangiellaceae bacterium]|nr:hypothetical protein [Kangiellaceae bacterium]